ncbi:MAG: type II toxin-antitoxin system RelE/ParE family toxin [Candidatus Scatovivens sp.]
MDNKKYNIKYLSTFVNQLNNILYHLTYVLRNKNAAEKFREEVIEKIEKRSKSTTSFEIFKKSKNEQINWYRIYVKNYTIFYVVKNDVMEVRRIYYSKRSFKKLI